jgi:hypothetical protein
MTPGDWSSSTGTIAAHYCTTSTASEYVQVEPAGDEDCEFFTPFPVIERQWLRFRWWLFDLKPNRTAKPVKIHRKTFTRGQVRRRYPLSSVLRASRQRRLKYAGR